MSTSGSYEKFFRAEGRSTPTSWTHAPGFPAQGTLSVFGRRAAHHRQRGVGQAVLCERPPMGGEHKPRDFAFFFAKTGRIHHARGSHDKPFFGRLPPPADRRAAGLVYAAGGPLPASNTGRSARNTAFSKSASGPTWRPRSPCSRWRFWTWMPPSFSPTCCCPLSRWA